MASRSHENRLARTVFFLSFNIVCSIIIVLLNKWVYVYVGFPNLTLTLFHFVTTFVGLVICERFNVFQVKFVPVKEVLLLAATFCGFVIFTNLSLQHNTVGTFQIAKVMTTPAIVIIQMLFYRKSFTFLIKCTLVPIILGVVMNFYYDIKFNYLGTVYAILGVLVTSLYQVLVNEKQHELQMDPMQLLYYQAPISSGMLVLIILITEPPLTTFNHGWTLTDLTMVFLSSLTAFFVNISIYWIIGNTSPLTYNMVGHLKFCLTVISGYLLFKEPMTMMQGVGVLLTMLGVTSYAHLKRGHTRTEHEKCPLVVALFADPSSGCPDKHYAQVSDWTMSCEAGWGDSLERRQKQVPVHVHSCSSSSSSEVPSETEASKNGSDVANREMEMADPRTRYLHGLSVHKRTNFL